MTGKTHMLFGSVASLYLLPKLGYEPDISTTVAALLGSLIPDMDHPRAKINQKILPIKNKQGKILFYSGISLFLLFRYGLNNQSAISTAILLIIIAFSKHRSFTHSLLGIFAISFTSLFALEHITSYETICSLIIGLISHLIGDFLTISGIPLFYPFFKKRYNFVFIMSSSKLAEPIICVFLIFSIFYLT
ncbi:metal-dependent hydrolase [Lutibacter sp. B2]|nr:metal-dependent hydrolase [Lutibacter sp. B2]